MKGFLKQFKEGPKGEVVYASLKEGFLMLSYEDNGRIYQAAFVKQRGADAGGDQPQLYFVWIKNFVTFKSENSMGGRKWSGGGVSSGTTLETDDDGPVTSEKTVTLDDWVDECVEEMSNENV